MKTDKAAPAPCMLQRKVVEARTGLWGLREDGLGDKKFM